MAEEQPMTGKTARVKIVSDGTTTGTRITIDGRPVLGVTYVMWSLGVGDQIARVHLDLDGAAVDVELTGETGDVP